MPLGHSLGISMGYSGQTARLKSPKAAILIDRPKFFCGFAAALLQIRVGYRPQFGLKRPRNVRFRRTTLSKKCGQNGRLAQKVREPDGMKTRDRNCLGKRRCVCVLCLAWRLDIFGYENIKAATCIEVRRDEFFPLRPAEALF